MYLGLSRYNPNLPSAPLLPRSNIDALATAYKLEPKPSRLSQLGSHMMDVPRTNPYKDPYNAIYRSSRWDKESDYDDRWAYCSTEFTDSLTHLHPDPNFIPLNENSKRKVSRFVRMKGLVRAVCKWWRGKVWGRRP